MGPSHGVSSPALCCSLSPCFILTPSEPRAAQVGASWSGKLARHTATTTIQDDNKNTSCLCGMFDVQFEAVLNTGTFSTSLSVCLLALKNLIAKSTNVKCCVK
jgi:hypothetical protein